MIRRVKRIKPKKRFTPAKVVNPEKTGDAMEHVFLPPLAPRRRLLVITSIVFGVWVVFLIAMYATTLYPQKFATRKVRVMQLPAPETPTTEPTTQPAEEVPTTQTVQ